VTPPIPPGARGAATWLVSVVDDAAGPLAMVIIQPDTEPMWHDIHTRLHRAGVGRISSREWTSLGITDSTCTVHVDQQPPAGRLVRLFTGRSSFYAADLPMTERWMAAATGRGRVVFGLVPPKSLPDDVTDIDLTGDDEARARIDQLAADRHLIGGLGRVVID